MALLETELNGAYISKMELMFNIIKQINNNMYFKKYLNTF